jgi:hypothetical protein
VRPEFQPFPKLSRLSRDMTITEKIDGTNASVFVTEDCQVFAASRTRWITPDDDNFGFAAWVKEHEYELHQLGPGQHFGEWWGRGIQRGYGLEERRFSLFNTHKWGETRPACCHVVPVLHHGSFNTGEVDLALVMLAERGSFAAPGFMKPEGVVVYHHASGQLFKKTLDKNDGHKGAA